MPNLDPQQWGNAAEWVAALGTIGTLGFVVWGLAAERRARRTDEARARAIQARRVHLWIKDGTGSYMTEASSLFDADGLLQRGTIEQFGVVLSIENRSDSEIRDCEFVAHLPYLRVVVNAEGHRRGGVAVTPAVSSRPVLRPGDGVVDISCVGKTQREESFDLGTVLEEITCQTATVSFTDADGTRWLKTHTGELVEVPAAEVRPDRWWKWTRSGSSVGGVET